MQNSTKKYVVGIAAVLLIIASWRSLSEYLQLSFSMDNIWLLLLPFTLYVRTAKKKSSFYWYPALLSVLLHALLPSPFFIFLAVCFAIFWLIEQHFGRLNRLSPVVVILIAPLTEYFFQAFGFPLRLQLTKLAGTLLQSSGLDVSWQGNQILLRGKEFSVDPACMGLNMVITSFLVSILILSSLEQIKKREISLKVATFYLLGASLLILFTNLIRIMLLVILQSAPDSFSHQLIGMVCLLFLTVLPLLLLAYYLVIRTKTPLVKEKTEIRFTKKSIFFYALMLIALFLSNGLAKDYVDIPADSIANNIELAEFEKEILNNNIVKFHNASAIIYIKPSKGIFRTNHNPRVCWVGSGYKFKKEKIEQINGTEVYTSELHFEGKVLHTAWWYDNGISKTNSQIEWRWKEIQGEPSFRMINLTTKTEAELKENVGELLQVNLFGDEWIE